MKKFSLLPLVAFLLTGLLIQACSTKTSGSKIIASKTEFELKDSVVVGKTTKKEVYQLYGEPTKNFGKVSLATVNQANTSSQQNNVSQFVGSLRALRDGDLNEPDDESYKITNPKTTNLIMYSYTTRKSNSAKRYIPFAGNFMSVETDLELKAFYIGFDDNDIVTERWYSHTKRKGSSKDTYF